MKMDDQSMVTRETLLPQRRPTKPAVEVEVGQPLPLPTTEDDADPADLETGGDRMAHSHKVYASDPNLAISVDNSVRARIRRAMSTHRFQVVIVSMVIIDCMVVISELLMDLRILGMIDSLMGVDSSKPTGQQLTNQSKPHQQLSLEAQYLIPDVLHSINIAILAMFLLETVVKVCAFGLAFLRLGWEIFDAVVVLVAFTLDVLLQHSHSSANGFGLVIILRLWRVARILNGMVKSVKTQAVRRVECERRRREGLEEELDKCHKLIRQQEEVIVHLTRMLKSHGVDVDVDNPSFLTAVTTNSTSSV